MINIYKIIRSILFLLPPEKAHKISSFFLSKCPRWLAKNKQTKSISNPIELFGVRFPNRVGSAPGLDNDGKAIHAWHAMGFGFVELGGVTPKPQPGNPSPRMFRLKKHRAIINRMGFPNKGIDNLIKNIKQAQPAGIIGVNVAKNMQTSLDTAFEDYKYCIEAIYPYVDYINVNISSPNTPGLRELQKEDYLDDLLEKLKNLQNKMAKKHKKHTALLIKIAPDLKEPEIKNIADLIKKHHVDGVVVSNTSISRSGVEESKYSAEKGGLSGKPIFNKSNQVLKQMRAELGPNIPIIGIGGIMSEQDALKKLELGASLVQIMTGLIYEGPSLVSKIINATES